MSTNSTQWPPRASTVAGVLAAASSIVDYNGWSGRDGRIAPRSTSRGPAHAATDTVGAIQIAATGHPTRSNELSRAAVKEFEKFIGDNADLWNDAAGRTAREVIDELAAAAVHERECEIEQAWAEREQRRAGLAVAR